MWTSITTFVFLLGIILTFISNVSTENYLIAPSPNECDRLDAPCTTLTSFATNTSSYIQFNTKLVLLPGNHTLHSKLSLININQLQLLSNTSHSNVLCINNTARFEFTNITHILISGVNFLGCRGNEVESVKNFILVNTTFDGQAEDECLGRKHSTKYRNFYYSPGAVLVSKTTATFLNCSFYGNSGPRHNGGAIYGDPSSNISITISTFYCNSGWFGGAVFAGSSWSNTERSGTLFILASTFSYNGAHGGGAVAAFNINVSIHESKFMNNQAGLEGGGALLSDKSGMTTINRTVFENNHVTSANSCGGAVRMYNITLSMFNSTVSRNSVNGHGGALCLQESANEISDCTFNFNEAATFGGAIYARNSHHTHLLRCSFDTNILRSPSGGGRAMRIYREHLMITNSTFTDRGYLAYNDGYETYHNHTSHCQESNAGYRVSGVDLIVTSSRVLFEGTTFRGSCESIYAYKCKVNFTGNNSFIGIDNEQSKAPSALYIIQSTVSIDGKSTFMHNVAVSGGAIHASESRIDVNGELVVANNRALDNGGGIYLYRSDFNCRTGSNINIASNHANMKGGGIHAISSAITVTYVRDSYAERSSLYFSRNTATNGGGVYLEANAKLIVIKEGTTGSGYAHKSSIFFTDNKAERCGGAVYIADETIGATCDHEGSTHLRYSDATECFIQVLTVLLMENVRKSALKLVAVEFENNIAQSGALIFGGLLDRCTVSPIAEVDKYSRDHTELSKSANYGITYILNITNITNDDLKSIRSKPVQICFCVGNHPNCSHQPPSKRVNYGEKFNISLVAVDQVNHTVENVIIFSSVESSKNWLSKGQSVQNTSDSCTNLTFSVLSSGNVSTSHNYTLHLYADGPCKSADRSKRKIRVHLQPCSCAVGLEISSESDKCDCVCDSRLKDYTTICSKTKGVLERNKNFWISIITSSTQKFCDSSKYLGHLNCPFDYCVPGSSRVEINLSISNGADIQCAKNRIGVLCSQCKPGYSLSVGSSKCIHCSKFWRARMTGIVLAVAIAGLILVAIVLILNLTVAAGTINGLIFYANVVGSTSEPLMFALPKFIVAWLNLDSGIDGCFINGLDAYWRTWLKFVFPVYILILVASVILLSKFSLKFSQVIGKRNPVAALNTLILISYSKLLHYFSCFNIPVHHYSLY